MPTFTCMRSLKGQRVVVDVQGGRTEGGGMMSISGDITWVADGMPRQGQG